MEHTVDDSEKSESLRGLIAWLSLCLLAAAWGPNLPAESRAIWGNVGTFGLVAAVGLSLAARVRAVRRTQRHKQKQEECIDQRLTQVVTHSESVEALRTTVALLQSDLRERAAVLPSATSNDTLGSGCPVEVLLLDPVFGPRASGRPLTVYLRDLSNGGIGLLHRVPLPTGRVLLKFHLMDGGTKTLTADIRWCRKIDDRLYWSGGPLLEVTPSETSEVPSDATTAPACAV
jgi:hypothetical protein